MLNIEIVSFLSGGQKMVGRLLSSTKSTQSRPGIVFFHGSGSDKEGWVERAKPLAEKGFVCLAFDFRGCGESEGNLDEQTFQDAIDDALAGYDFLVKQAGVDPEKIGVGGRSFGGYLAAVVCGQRKVNCLMLSVPANFKDSVLDQTYMDSNDDVVNELKTDQDFEQSQASKAITHFKGDLLVVEHEFDEVVPKIVVKRYFDDAKLTQSKKYYVIKDSKHRIEKPVREKEFVDLMADWFAKN